MKYIRNLITPLCVLVVIFCFYLNGYAKSSPKADPDKNLPRMVLPLNQDWHFIKKSLVAAKASNAKQWQVVTLPHTWNVKDGLDGGGDYYRGLGTYQRQLNITKSMRGKRAYLHFDGATSSAKVYVNNIFVGEHKGNYAAFRFDITKQLNFDKANIIEVEVNNEVDNGIAPLSADFTFFGGLYRQAELIITDAVHVDMLDYASSGVFWSQNKVNNKRAVLSVSSRIVNDSNLPQNLTMVASIFDKQGKLVTQVKQEQLVASNSTYHFNKSLTVVSPQLWHGIKDPYLYRTQLAIYNQDRLLDVVEDNLGLRFFHVDAEKGFFLNGEPYALHGVNRMADFPGKGTAVTKAEHDLDMQLMLDIGATGTRLGHQQRDDYVYDMADKNGMIVWAEVPLINRINDNPEFYQNVKQQAMELVKQNYNHSSILFWGLFNEVTLKKGPDPRPLVIELNDIVKRLDGNRLTTAAVVAENAFDDPLVTTTDLTSFNRYYGWYHSSFAELDTFLDQTHKAAPHLKLGLSEFGAGASISYHSDNPVMQDHTEEYQALFHEHYWETMAARPNLWGKFVWVLADFAVDHRDEGDTPGRNDKGLVTFDRKVKKDAYFWYQANWSEKPMLHITSRSYQQRTSDKVSIKVYSNLAEVSLSINNKLVSSESLGGAKKYTWKNVPLQMGDNQLLVTGKDALGNVIEDKIVLTRVESKDTQLKSKLFGVDNDQGIIYNLPYGLSFDELKQLITYPDFSEVKLISPSNNNFVKENDVIEVTAQDKVTRQKFVFKTGPLSRAKATSASKENNSEFSIGPFTAPVMTSARANDGIVNEANTDFKSANLWLSMERKGPQWWKVDLGAVYYLESIEQVWPQALKNINLAAMSYRVEVAGDFKQSFDDFSEHYQEVVDKSDNAKTGTTYDHLGLEGRFVKVTLLNTKSTVKVPVMGNYPLYGSEEISIVGGLLKSDELEVDYQHKTIKSPTSIQYIGALDKMLTAVSGGHLVYLDAQEQTLTNQDTIADLDSIIVYDEKKVISEQYQFD